MTGWRAQRNVGRRLALQGLGHDAHDHPGFAVGNLAEKRMRDVSRSLWHASEGHTGLRGEIVHQTRVREAVVGRQRGGDKEAHQRAVVPARSRKASRISLSMANLAASSRCSQSMSQT